MSYSAYKESRKKMLAELRKLGVSSPSTRYPLLSIDSMDWGENQLFNMQGHIAELQERQRYASAG